MFAAGIQKYSRAVRDFLVERLGNKQLRIFWAEVSAKPTRVTCRFLLLGIVPCTLYRTVRGWK